jgi:RNA polymerase sigma-70 factor (ECF subfamily)
MINTSIDYYRKQPRNTYSIEIDEVRTLSSSQADAIEEINEKDLLKLVQSLPPAYRTVFNLYVLEGFKHEEIAKKLNIHVGTSKSNLAKARKHLQNKLKKLEKIKQ